MKLFLITFRSLTLAQRAERAMTGEGIACHVRRTPRWMEEKGCGYGVEARLSQLEQGVGVLREAGIPYRKTYLMHPEGTVEELRNDLS